jgi:hypothetical protein
MSNEFCLLAMCPEPKSLELFLDPNFFSMRELTKREPQKRVARAQK